METETKIKKCPFCKNKEIDIKETKCPQCQSSLRDWFEKHKTLAIIGGILLLFGIFRIISVDFSRRNFPSPSTSPEIYVLTEQECETVLDEIMAVIDNKLIAKSELSKNILERYLRDAGIAVKNPTGNLPRYTLPQSDCGMALDGLLKVMISGMR